MDEDEDMLMLNTDELPQKHHLLLLTEEEEKDFKKQKWTPLSDLTDLQLTELFGEGLRFELCNAYLIYNHTAADHKLFGTIRVAAGEIASGFSTDPLLQQNGFSDIFNREFNNPVQVTCIGYQYLHDMRYCSLPVSSTSTVQITAKLYVTNDEVDDVDKYPEEDHEEVDDDDDDDEDDDEDDEILRIGQMFKFYSYDDKDTNKTSKQPACNSEAASTLQNSGNVKRFNNLEAFQVCDGHEFINLSEKPNGGSGRNIIKGRDGSLDLCYVALKYAVDAHLEVEFVPPSKESKVTGRIVAYYGKKFDYLDPPGYFSVLLSQTDSFAYLEHGKINLIRSELAVPAQFSLIVEAELRDDTSGVILSSSYEFPVPSDDRSCIGRIKGKDCSLKVTVTWKLPFEKAKVPSSPPAPFSSNSSVGHLAPSILSERRKSGASSMADSDDDNRWSLQEEIEKVFNASLERTFGGDHPCSISTCTKDVDNGDYLCSSVLHIWPQLRDTSYNYKGPKHAGLAVKDDIVGSVYNDMMERCVVCGPGFVKFKLSRKWIAKSIQKMLMHGIDTWAPKLSLEKAIIYFLSRNLTEEMHMGHLRSTSIREALARMLEYSGVVVLQKGIHDGDHLELKVHASSYFEDKSSDDPIKTLDLVRELGLASFSDGDEAVSIEGRKLPLVYLTALRHALYTEKADWILYVTDVEQGDYIGTCISAAKCADWLTEDHPEYLLSHVGFGFVQFDDFKRFQTLGTQVDNLVSLLDEAKSRCKALLAGQGMADEDLDHAAEALGYGVIKYVDLKNNRLANYTFDMDQALNKEGNTAVYIQFTHARICSIMRDSSKDIKKLKAEELVLKNDDEREFGLHLLRFTEVLREACTILAPHILCEYLYVLCVKFNNLNVCEIGGSSEETSRILLCEAVEVVVRKCFDLLGIAPISKI